VAEGLSTAVVEVFSAAVAEVFSASEVCPPVDTVPTTALVVASALDFSTEVVVPLTTLLVGKTPPKLPGLVAIIELVLCVSVVATMCTVGAPVGCLETKFVHSLSHGYSEEMFGLRAEIQLMYSMGTESNMTFADCGKGQKGAKGKERRR